MKKLEMLKFSLIAHRGIHNDEIPENSIAAFENAIYKKFMIELDVHLLKDKQIVVFHDDNLKRMTGIDKNIKDCTYEELKKINLNNNSSIPLLDDVLKLINGRVPVLIELKYDQKVGKLEKELTKILDNYNGDFAVQSFSPLSVFWFKKNRSNYIRGQLLTNNYKANFIIKFLYDHMIFNKITKPDFISYNIKGLPNKNISKIKNKIILLGWTVKNQEEYDKYKNECDNLICEKIL